MSNKKSSRATTIPESLQKKMRKKMAMLRESRRIFKTEIKTVSASSLMAYENQDISRLRLGDLYGLATEYGVTFDEILDLLKSNTNGPEDLDEMDFEFQRLKSYFTSMSDGDRELISSIGSQLASRNLSRRETDLGAIHVTPAAPILKATTKND